MSINTNCWTSKGACTSIWIVIGHENLTWQTCWREKYCINLEQKAIQHPLLWRRDWYKMAQVSKAKGVLGLWDSWAIILCANLVWNLSCTLHDPAPECAEDKQLKFHNNHQKPAQGRLWHCSGTYHSPAPAEIPTRCLHPHGEHPSQCKIHLCPIVKNLRDETHAVGTNNAWYS